MEDLIVQQFFGDSPPDLHNISSGEDSRVYVYHDPRNREGGILKLYYPHITPALLQTYREITERVREQIDAISTSLDLSFYFLNNNALYGSQLEIIPVGRIKERNGVCATLANEWIQGTGLGRNGMNQTKGVASVESISSEGTRLIECVSPVSVDDSGLISSLLSATIKEAIGDDRHWLVVPANVKLRVDHQQRKVHLIITDLLDEIHILEH